MLIKKLGFFIRKAAAVIISFQLCFFQLTPQMMSSAYAETALIMEKPSVPGEIKPEDVKAETTEPLPEDKTTDFLDSGPLSQDTVPAKIYTGREAVNISDPKAKWNVRGDVAWNTNDGRPLTYLVDIDEKGTYGLKVSAINIPQDGFKLPENYKFAVEVRVAGKRITTLSIDPNTEDHSAVAELPIDKAGTYKIDLTWLNDDYDFLKRENPDIGFERIEISKIKDEVIDPKLVPATSEKKIFAATDAVAPEDNGWYRDGTVIWHTHSDPNRRLSYQMKFQEEGRYIFDLFAVNMYRDAPANYEGFRVEVYVDGNKMPQIIEIPANRFTEQKGTFELQLSAGEHTIEFDWTNDSWDPSNPLNIKDANVGYTHLDVTYKRDPELIAKLDGLRLAELLSKKFENGSWDFNFKTKEKGRLDLKFSYDPCGPDAECDRPTVPMTLSVNLDPAVVNIQKTVIHLNQGESLKVDAGSGFELFFDPVSFHLEEVVEIVADDEAKVKAIKEQAVEIFQKTQGETTAWMEEIKGVLRNLNAIINEAADENRAVDEQYAELQANMDLIRALAGEKPEFQDLLAKAEQIFSGAESRVADWNRWFQQTLNGIAVQEAQLRDNDAALIDFIGIYEKLLKTDDLAGAESLSAALKEKAEGLPIRYMLPAMAEIEKPENIVPELEGKNRQLTEIIQIIKQSEIVPVNQLTDDEKRIGETKLRTILRLAGVEVLPSRQDVFPPSYTGRMNLYAMNKEGDVVLTLKRLESVCPPGVVCIMGMREVVSTVTVHVRANVNPVPDRELFLAEGQQETTIGFGEALNLIVGLEPRRFFLTDGNEQGIAVFPEPIRFDIAAANFQNAIFDNEGKIVAGAVLQQPLGENFSRRVEISDGFVRLSRVTYANDIMVLNNVVTDFGNVLFDDEAGFAGGFLEISILDVRDNVQSRVKVYFKNGQPDFSNIPDGLVQLVNAELDAAVQIMNYRKAAVLPSLSPEELVFLESVSSILKLDNTSAEKNTLNLSFRGMKEGGLKFSFISHFSSCNDVYCMAVYIEPVFISLKVHVVKGHEPADGAVVFTNMENNYEVTIAEGGQLNLVLSKLVGPKIGWNHTLISAEELPKPVPIPAPVAFDIKTANLNNAVLDNEGRIVAGTVMQNLANGGRRLISVEDARVTNTNVTYADVNGVISNKLIFNFNNLEMAVPPSGSMTLAILDADGALIHQSEIFFKDGAPDYSGVSEEIAALFEAEWNAVSQVAAYRAILPVTQWPSEASQEILKKLNEVMKWDGKILGVQDYAQEQIQTDALNLLSIAGGKVELTVAMNPCDPGVICKAMTRMIHFVLTVDMQRADIRKPVINLDKIEGDTFEMAVGNSGVSFVSANLRRFSIIEADEKRAEDVELLRQKLITQTPIDEFASLLLGIESLEALLQDAQKNYESVLSDVLNQRDNIQNQMRGNAEQLQDSLARLEILLQDPSATGNVEEAALFLQEAKKYISSSYPLEADAYINWIGAERLYQAFINLNLVRMRLDFYTDLKNRLKKQEITFDELTLIQNEMAQGFMYPPTAYPDFTEPFNPDEKIKNLTEKAQQWIASIKILPVTQWPSEASQEILKKLNEVVKWDGNLVGAADDPRDIRQIDGLNFLSIANGQAKITLAISPCDPGIPCEAAVRILTLVLNVAMQLANVQKPIVNLDEIEGDVFEIPVGSSGISFIAGNLRQISIIEAVEERTDIEPLRRELLAFVEKELTEANDRIHELEVAYETSSQKLQAATEQLYSDIAGLTENLNAVLAELQAFLEKDGLPDELRAEAEQFLQDSHAVLGSLEADTEQYVLFLQTWYMGGIQMGLEMYYRYIQDLENYRPAIKAASTSEQLEDLRDNPPMTMYYDVMLWEAPDTRESLKTFLEAASLLREKLKNVQPEIPAEEPPAEEPAEETYFLEFPSAFGQKYIDGQWWMQEQISMWQEYKQNGEAIGEPVPGVLLEPIKLWYEYLDHSEFGDNYVEDGNEYYDLTTKRVHFDSEFALPTYEEIVKVEKMLLGPVDSDFDGQPDNMDPFPNDPLNGDADQNGILDTIDAENARAAEAERQAAIDSAQTQVDETQAVFTRTEKELAGLKAEEDVLENIYQEAVTAELASQQRLADLRVNALLPLDAQIAAAQTEYENAANAYNFVLYASTDTRIAYDNAVQAVNDLQNVLEKIRLANEEIAAAQAEYAAQPEDAKDSTRLDNAQTALSIANAELGNLPITDLSSANYALQSAAINYQNSQNTLVSLYDNVNKAAMNLSAVMNQSTQVQAGIDEAQADYDAAQARAAAAFNNKAAIQSFVAQAQSAVTTAQANHEAAVANLAALSTLTTPPATTPTVTPINTPAPSQISFNSGTATAVTHNSAHVELRIDGIDPLKMRVQLILENVFDANGNARVYDFIPAAASGVYAVDLQHLPSSSTIQTKVRVSGVNINQQFVGPVITTLQAPLALTTALMRQINYDTAVLTATLNYVPANVSSVRAAYWDSSDPSAVQYKVMTRVKDANGNDTNDFAATFKKSDFAYQTSLRYSYQIEAMDNSNIVMTSASANMIKMIGIGVGRMEDFQPTDATANIAYIISDLNAYANSNRSVSIVSRVKGAAAVTRRTLTVSQYPQNTQLDYVSTTLTNLQSDKTYEVWFEFYEGTRLIDQSTPEEFKTLAPNQATVADIRYDATPESVTLHFDPVNWVYLPSTAYARVEWFKDGSADPFDPSNPHGASNFVCNQDCSVTIAGLEQRMGYSYQISIRDTRDANKIYFEEEWRQFFTSNYPPAMMQAPNVTAAMTDWGKVIINADVTVDNSRFYYVEAWQGYHSLLYVKMLFMKKSDYDAGRFYDANNRPLSQSIVLENVGGTDRWTGSEDYLSSNTDYVYAVTVEDRQGNFIVPDPNTNVYGPVSYQDPASVFAASKRYVVKTPAHTPVTFSNVNVATNFPVQPTGKGKARIMATIPSLANSAVIVRVAIKTDDSPTIVYHTMTSANGSDFSVEIDAFRNHKYQYRVEAVSRANNELISVYPTKCELTLNSCPSYGEFYQAVV